MTTRAVLLLLLGVTALHSASAVSLSRPGAQKRRPSVAAAARQLSGPAYGRPTGKSGPANGLVTKLLALPTPRSGVDSVAVERILRTTDGLQGKQLLEVLQALRKQRKWQLMLALGKLLEARATTAAPGAGARRTAEADGAWGAWEDDDEWDDERGGDGEATTMADLLGDGAGLTPVEAPAARAPVETVHYNVMIAACAPPRKWKEAVELFDRMGKRGVERSTTTCARNSGPRKFPPRKLGRAILLSRPYLLCRYNSVLHALERGGNWRGALKILKQMRAEGVAPDTITFSTAIAACARGGAPGRALSLYGTRAARFGPPSSPPSHPLPPPPQRP